MFEVLSQMLDSTIIVLMNIIYEHNMAITKDKAQGIISDNYDIVFDIASANNFVNAKKYLEVNSYDGGIYFLDIELGREIGKNNGFDLAGLIKKQDKKAQIIFITTHADLSLISFERRLGPIDYIVKPKNEDEYT